MVTSSPVFKPTRSENIAEALRWLDRAIKLDADGKSESMVNMALARAVAYEDHAFTLPA